MVRRICFLIQQFHINLKRWPVFGLVPNWLVMLLMPVEHIIFLSVDLVELALEYGFAGIKTLFFFIPLEL